ncbi:Fructosamine kinase-domain-containing protein [Microdochium bolleyi]|uniref:protein-ribulosamine 3-kinase n=1 Tax=Microdochium bolleyi TaxID=196109 RepID=A0A136IL44_9PEZI|nr:Fructosamine kinase-domain-containing protein [Microdochium bolleyi]
MTGPAEPAVPKMAIEFVDEAVLAELPMGIQQVAIKPHGFSFWTRTARLDTTLTDQRSISYFIKATHGDLGRDMVLGEFTSMTRIHGLQPKLVPRPLAWGSYTSLPEVHFLLCEFRPMRETGGVPGIDELARAIAAFHLASSNREDDRSSSTTSERYGNDMTTYHGNVPVEHGWSDTWEEYFARTTRHLLSVELESRGGWGAVNDSDKGASMTQEKMANAFFTEVVPRLLRPIEASIRPTLIHGDLWHGNVGVDESTGEPIIFDAASFWAHNEYELAVWRQPWNEITDQHRYRYHDYFPKAEPADEFDDRNLLYSVRVNILDSILYKDDPSYRKSYVEALYDLVHKYGQGRL